MEEKERRKFRVIVGGTSEMSDYDFLKSKCDLVLSRKLSDPDFEVIIVSSDSKKGVDILAEKYAQEKGLEFKKYKTDWDKLGKKAGIYRNRRMSEESNACIAFLSGDEVVDRGIKNLVSIATKEKLLLREIYYPSRKA